MVSLCIRAAVLLLLSIAWLCPISAQDLPTLLSDFASSIDRASRESILLEITEHHPEAGPALLKIARKTEDTETRWLAIRGIGWLKYKEAVPFLRECLHSSSSYVRANSASALGEVHDVSAVADLIHTLAVDEDSGVLEQTSSALLMLDAKQAIPVLKARSNNSSPQTRVWLIGAIEALGSKDVQFFADFLFDKNGFVAGYAAHAIERITSRILSFRIVGNKDLVVTVMASRMPNCGGTFTKLIGHNNGPTSQLLSNADRGQVESGAKVGCSIQMDGNANKSGVEIGAVNTCPQRFV